jgi:lipopolysaccharide export system ATP-binding protein
MSSLVIKSLSKQYQGREVVKNVSFELHEAEVVGLLGPNGAGKTTSFYLTLGLVKPERGEILLDGKIITSLSVSDRAKLGIGYLPQEASVFRKLSVHDNIMAILELRDDLSSQDREQQLTQLLGEFSLTHLIDHKGSELSGGERRRVEIARALAMNPKFILLDEPFAGVDPIAVIEIKKIIEHLKKRRVGVLITDHNVRDTLNICDRAYIVNNGEVIAEGLPKQIVKNKEVREVYLGKDFVLNE